MPKLTGTIKLFGTGIQVGLRFRPMGAPYKAGGTVHSDGYKTVSTDASGYFEIAAMPAGTYQVAWEANGVASVNTFTLPGTDPEYDLAALISSDPPDPGAAWINDAEQALVDAAAAQATADEAIARLDAIQFQIETSSLTATISAGTLAFPDGQRLAVAGGSVTVFDARTNYIGVSLVDGSWHALRARIDSGTVFVGEVVVSGGAVTAVVQYPTPIHPVGRVERFKGAIKNSGHGLRLVTVGNSLVDGSYGAAWKAFDAVFSASASPATYQVPNASGLTWKRYEYGGQTSAAGLMWVGGRHYQSLVARDGHGASVILGDDWLSHETVSGAVYSQSPASMGPDLVVINDWFNAGRENWLLIEAMVRSARAAGAEVVLCTDNDPRDSESSIWSEYDKWRVLAVTYGVAIADTRAYMEEQKKLGVTVYSDASHPNATGVAIYAARIRSVLSAYPHVADCGGAIPAGRVLPIETPGDYPNGVVARQIDVQVIPASTDGAWVATAIGGGSTYYEKIPGKVFAGRTDSDCVLELGTGEVARFGHPFALRMDVIVETSTPTSFSIQQLHPETLALISTLSPGADTPAVKSYELLAANSVLAYTDPSGSEGSGSPLRNFSCLLKCSAGSARILGVMFHTVPHREVPRRNLFFGGAWAREDALSGALPGAVHTDTIGSDLSFAFEGTACAILLAAHSAAGKVDVWCDGAKAHTAHDLYTSASGVMTRSLLVFPARTTWSGATAAAGYGMHTVRLSYSALNGSAGSVVAGSKRRVQILGVHALDTR